jgi:hypothetical protein
MLITCVEGLARGLVGRLEVVNGNIVRCVGTHDKNVCVGCMVMHGGRHRSVCGLWLRGRGSAGGTVRGGQREQVCWLSVRGAGVWEGQMEVQTVCAWCRLVSAGCVVVCFVMCPTD